MRAEAGLDGAAQLFDPLAGSAQRPFSGDRRRDAVIRQAKGQLFVTAIQADGHLGGMGFTDSAIQYILRRAKEDQFDLGWQPFGQPFQGQGDLQAVGAHRLAGQGFQGWLQAQGLQDGRMQVGFQVSHLLEYLAGQGG